ncbi:MAG: hypothetical protein AAFQ89_09320 [Cyanobacteria bacterium J06626_18]
MQTSPDILQIAHDALPDFFKGLTPEGSRANVAKALNQVAAQSSSS